MIKFRLKFVVAVLLLNVCSSYQENVIDDDIKKDNGDQQVSNENVELTNNQVCTPHEVKMEDCNRCRCAANGIGWFCTRKACPPKPLNRKKRRVPVNSPGFRCIPGETFMDDCNTCWCHESGNFACTLMACPPKNIHKREISSTEPPKIVCKPGDSFMDECNNSCWCNPEGTGFMCTMMGCSRTFFTSRPKTIEKRSVRVKKSTSSYCTPGETFMEDCNTCICHESGNYAACTMMACPPKNIHKREISSTEPPKIVCKPGDSYMDDCNGCWCNPEGTGFMCTMMDCPPKNIHKREISPDQPIQPPVNKCTPGESYMKDCNRCWCNENGIAMCTLKFCGYVPTFNRLIKRDIPTKTYRLKVTSAELRNPSFSCIPGEIFKVDCNSCECNTDGKSALWCTRMACVQFPNTLPNNI
jgi:hypothetical protein